MNGFGKQFTDQHPGPGVDKVAGVAAAPGGQAGPGGDPGRTGRGGDAGVEIDREAPGIGWRWCTRPRPKYFLKVMTFST